LCSILFGCANAPPGPDVQDNLVSAGCACRNKCLGQQNEGCKHQPDTGAAEAAPDTGAARSAARRHGLSAGHGGATALEAGSQQRGPGNEMQTSFAGPLGAPVQISHMHFAGRTGCCERCEAQPDVGGLQADQDEREHGVAAHIFTDASVCRSAAAAKRGGRSGHPAARPGPQAGARAHRMRGSG